MWEQVLKLRVLQYDTPLILNHVFTSSAIVVSAALEENGAFPFGKRTYQRVGTLKPVFAINNVGFTYAAPKRLYLHRNLIRFENPYGYAYSLELYIGLWTSQLDLTFFQENELLVT